MCYGDGLGEDVDDIWFKVEESKQSSKIEFKLLPIISVSTSYGVACS